MKRVAFHTLGCKLNFSESSEIGRNLEAEGFTRVPFGQMAEVTVIHTCSVTGAADRKTRQAVSRAVRYSPDGFIVAMGCVAQLKPEEVAGWEGVDLILGTHEKFDLHKHLTNLEKRKQPEIFSCSLPDESLFHHAHSEAERTRAFLKVQDGCDYPCTYCTIPAARGSSRNAQVSELVSEARRIASRGIREIVLTGVNVADFGRSTGESFEQLIIALNRLKEVQRFRISSAEPNLMHDDLIRIIAESERFAPHFHLPLQAGTDKILKLMKRRYLTGLFELRVESIRKMIPDAGIGADIMVGFPGETDDDFKDACRFLESLPLSYLHVFTYSERPGTPASQYPDKVPHKVREARSRELHKLSDRKKEEFMKSQIGKTEKVIVETSTKRGTMTGLTGNYLQTDLVYDPLYLHTDCEVLLTGINASLHMTGEIIQNKKNGS